MEDCEVAFDNRFTRAFGAPLERIRNKVKDALGVHNCASRICWS
jgi:hypothetical protein